MSLDAEQLFRLAGVMKKMAQVPEQFKRRPPGRHKPSTMDQAYPDYSKALAFQMKTDPGSSGLKRGLETGTIGAILGALIAKMITDNPKHIAAASAGAGLLTGIPGYVSGRREAESEYSRLLSLRRLGINTLGELEGATKFPALTQQLTRRGEVL